MNKDVIISIKGAQTYSEVEGEDSIELVTEGVLSGSEHEGFTLSYQESELTGLEGTTTTFQIDKKRVILMRMGLVSSQMVFEEGRKHFSLYNTPYGSMTVGVSANHVSSTIGEHGGELEIQYAIEVDHAVTGENLFQVSVREAEKAIIQ